ncbi:histidine kinase [Undibacterium cyanobacteriorum]|uniref:Histidine kinase n=1 Tax=Undibacterium cyanobacteriorum TaxID=3073561 RepID=A0ABY9RG35_9BURK|nr:histidine kinase [Undibacterium sp. 20NA77.5]WMW80180.1 histidine kinase [Undibacterium sp. 20NA77.5]
MFHRLSPYPQNSVVREFREDWALLPLICVALLGLVSVWWKPHAMLADLAAILCNFALSKWTLNGLMRWHSLQQAWTRWTVLAIGFATAILLALKLQEKMWPSDLAPHATWVLPAILVVFVLVFVLPEAISAEVQRRTQMALQEEERKHRLQRQLLEAKLAALQGQIEPHFLYNTLANVRALIRQDADASEQMLNHLIAYLRAAMPDLRVPTTSLGQELERAEAYLKIMAIRLGERLQFEIEADAAARACLIPPLSVMTLVENAIEHAIEPQVQGGRIRLQAKIVDTQLQILVQDNGQGLKAELGDGVGLLNLQERLAAMYGDAAQLSFASEAEQGLSVSIMIPIEAAQINTSLGNQLKIAEAENH